jgi:hypothetical protein
LEVFWAKVVRAITLCYKNNRAGGMAQAVRDPGSNLQHQQKLKV